MIDRYDMIAGVGLALVAAGLVWVWWPLALIVPGAILLVLGVVGATRVPHPGLLPPAIDGGKGEGEE